MRKVTLFVAAITLAAPAAAQIDTAAIRNRQRLGTVMTMPQRVDQIRRAGVPESTIQEVLDVMNKQRVPPDEADEILVATRDAALEHGPTDNFGAFVQAQLASGKRGKDLAAAIKAEHQARGKGRPADAGAKGKAPATSPSKGKAPDAAPSKGKAPSTAPSKAKTPDAAAKGKAPAAAPEKGRRPPQ